ncbi:MAG: hypothetical protein H6737_03785 [Alphaproteobacteria bacterium]|nr:hypothetical protein [Alphaproteobacteria bacterium]
MLALLLATAQAAWPEDPSLSNMVEHDGVKVVDSALLSASYEELVAELGTAVANKQILPASTTGTYGFEFAIHNTFVFTDAKERDSEISPWDRAVPSEDAEPYLFIPTFSARKGLPLSTEIGGSIGWIGLTRTGLASVYGRVAVVEGYKPIPDLTLQIGYSGYIGNDELELGVMDMGVTLGSQFAVGSSPGMNTGRFEPFANFSLLRVSAAPTVDTRVIETVGAATYRRGKPDALPPIAIPQVAAGFQITNGNVHFRLAGSWAWSTLPTATAGMGFTF